MAEGDNRCTHHHRLGDDGPWPDCHCGFMPQPELNPEIVQRVADADAVAAEAPPAVESSKKTPWGKILPAAIGIAIAIALGVSHSGGSKAGTQYATNGDARHACETFVKSNLKSPSAARFSDEDVSNVGITYTVTGAVDSQNSFGASIRNTFTCTQTQGDTDWTLVSLTGLDN